MQAHGNKKRTQLGLILREQWRLLAALALALVPAGCDLGEHCVSLGVTSKTYGLAGLRIGWIATRNADVYRAMATFKDYLTICNSAPSEFLATLALQNAEAIVERKTVADLVLSLERRRLFRQLAGLGRAAARPLLIVEGEDARAAQALPVSALRGVLLTITAHLRVPILRTGSVLSIPSSVRMGRPS